MKTFKKLTAIFLALLMVLSVSPLAFAKDISFNQDCPNIYVHGFASNTLYADVSDPNSKAVFPPESDAVVKAVTKSLPALGVYMLNKDADMLCDTLVPAFRELFEPAFLDKDGNLPEGNNSGAFFSYPPRDSINKNSNVAFEYDWRLDPVEIASQLNDFVNYVCEASGCEKVTIMAHSFGGIVTLSYLKLYGMEKIKGVVMNSTAIYGQDYCGDLMTGDLDINMESVKAFLQFALTGTDYDTLVDGVLGVLSKYGALGTINDSINYLIDDVKDRIMGEVLMPMFLSWTSVWAMIHDEDVDASMDYIFGEGGYFDNGEDNSVLKSKIEFYNSEVRADKAETLKAAERNGHFGVYARYGFSSVPVTSSWKTLSDGIVDTKSASYGATTAPYGETLSDAYLENVDAKYISPDKTVDASTCLFPEKTWFIKNIVHDDTMILTDLMYAILYADEEVTVDTYEAYPRFIIHNNGIFTPQTEDDTLTPIQQIQRFFKQLFSLIKTLFSAVTGK